MRLADGVYRIEEPLLFGPADSPAEGHFIAWAAAPGGRPRISGGRAIEGNVIYDIDRSPLRFHRAEENTVLGNVLDRPDGDTPAVRYNRTPEEKIALVANQVLTMAEFDPDRLADFRDSTGPRVQPADVPDPAGAFD